jgi:hypothetical protein
MTTWDSLRVAVARLLDEQPGALTGYPDPRADRGQQPPFHIGLAAWAVDTTKELHERFGADVTLTVGALPYPSGEARQRMRDSTTTVDPERIGFELDGPLSVPSGHNANHGLLVTNRTDSDLTVHTNGHVTADVVDPRDGHVVGGFAGVQITPLVIFFIAAGTAHRFPLLVGTAGVDREIGYAVPPGAWAIRVTLVMGDGRRIRSPALPFTVTD